MPRRGPSRSKRGGLGTLLLGFLLAVAGAYLLTNQVLVGSGPFGGFAWFGPNSFGLLLVPLLIGVGLLIFNPRLLIGRLLTAGGAVILLAAVLEPLRISFRDTSLFIVLLMLGLLVSGVALMARSIGSGSSDDAHEGYELTLSPTSEPESQLTRRHSQSLPGAQSHVPLANPVRSVDDEMAEIRAKKAEPQT
jgi:hypothetical protein